MSDAPTYESTLRHYGLTNEQMKIECSDGVILAIVRQMKGWRNIAPYLKVDDSVVDAMAVDEERKRRELLERWKATFGHEATLERLARSFISAGQASLADLVCEERKKTLLSAGEVDRHEVPRQISADSAIGSEGRQSVCSPISPQSPGMLDTEQQPPHRRMSEEELKETVVELKSLLIEMVTKDKPLVEHGDSHPSDEKTKAEAPSQADEPSLQEHPQKGKKTKANKEESDFSLLMEACRLGKVDSAQLLLNKGADPNLANSEGWTALMAAASNGRLGTVDLLLQNGANPDMQDQTGWSALMAAVFKCHNDVALRIIEAGATPHIQDHNCTNALLLAIAKNKQEKVVDALLDSKPELNLQDSYGETALIYACKMRNLKFVKRLLSMGANPDIGNYAGETPALIAIGLDEKEILEALLHNNANPNIGTAPPLLVASHQESREIVDLLVTHGADPDQQDERGVTAYDVAEIKNFKDLAQKLNPKQLSSRTSAIGDMVKLTINSLASLQSHLSRGPLFFNPDTDTGDTSGFSWLHF